MKTSILIALILAICAVVSFPVEEKKALTTIMPPMIENIVWIEYEEA